MFSSSIGVDGDLVVETSHLPRIYVEAPSLLEKHIISLSPFQSNYLNVMRVTNPKRWGQWAGHVRIFNGKDGEWLAKVIISDASAETTPPKKQRRRQKGNSGGGSTILECVQQTIPQPTVISGGYVHLHMGKLKKQRRKWVLEKTTELGIAAIDVVDMAYSENKEPWEYEKHQAQIIEAAEQCERLTVPTLVTEPTSWSDLLERISESSPGGVDDNDSDVDHFWLVCRERSINDETLPMLSALEQIHNDASNDGRKSCIHILVGPEGGWSPKELEDLTNAKESNSRNNDNIHFVSLGSLVLRAETATISAVTATVLAMDQRRS
ncbi:MAG: hypothetical protein SGBAC_003985 [Bacillariaceae sp.]